MKVLGIDIIGSDLCWIGIEGQATRGQIFFMQSNKLVFPCSEVSDFQNLLQLKQLVVAQLTPLNLDCVGVVKSSIECTPLRVKCEFVVELACSEMNVPIKLIPTQTINAAEKRKIQQCTENTFAGAFNGNVEVSPKYLKRAAFCAWCLL